MNIEKVFIKDLLIIKPDVYYDSRGFFFESYNKSRFENIGLNYNFVQDNISKSKKGTIRGLHYQVGESAQDKLCFVLLGKVLDVAVDIRFGSPTFGKYFSIELSEENKLQFLIPKGFAHGFSVLSEEAVFCYKCSSFYNKNSERIIRFDDPNLSIDWKVDKPIVSDKDLNGKLFSEIDKDFTY
ncbi:dTDP-4-dehydrorhamnose 3,5-epimerase [Melioribacteraceae bacterium 4301-Me]|uniref:dTDP-4-dehydrorhamnose 3,5-epimerase n=1 Tax=Pyranulibacter aquaticus TaxID=3163344 RepID=UPI003594F3B6